MFYSDPSGNTFLSRNRCNNQSFIFFKRLVRNEFVTIKMMPFCLVLADLYLPNF